MIATEHQRRSFLRGRGAGASPQRSPGASAAYRVTPGPDHNDQDNFSTLSLPPVSSASCVPRWRYRWWLKDRSRSRPGLAAFGGGRAVSTLYTSVLYTIVGFSIWNAPAGAPSLYGRGAVDAARTIMAMVSASASARADPDPGRGHRRVPAHGRMLTGGRRPARYPNTSIEHTSANARATRRQPPQVLRGSARVEFQALCNPARSIRYTPAVHH